MKTLVIAFLLAVIFIIVLDAMGITDITGLAAPAYDSCNGNVTAGNCEGGKKTSHVTSPIIAEVKRNRAVETSQDVTPPTVDSPEVSTPEDSTPPVVNPPTDAPDNDSPDAGSQDTACKNKNSGKDNTPSECNAGGGQEKHN